MKNETPEKDLLTHNMEPASHISYQVTIVSNLMAFGGTKENQKRYGLTLCQWRIIGSIANAGPLTLGEIAKIIFHDKSTLSRAATELEKKGLLKRLANDQHKSSPILAFTKQGKAFYRETEPHFIRQAEELTAGLNLQEKQQLCFLLDKLKNHAVNVRRSYES
ncbi:MarR family winged helix-turn-helix transcriptional regulator [Kordiimonas pumila]|uniref:MarR family winged helix-turn-helix transcriptional regulator n=1 Tax=Kordiimonas pumila TaxID=2161677 RepID=A0ABV7D6W6_9PROT|nr:MarR family transcriptional regulator [Kordiimonas pumila]